MNYTLFIFDRDFVTLQRVSKANWYTAVRDAVGGLIQEDPNVRLSVKIGEATFKPKVWVNEEGFPLRLLENTFFGQYRGPVVVSFRDRFELVNLVTAAAQVRAHLTR